MLFKLVRKEIRLKEMIPFVMLLLVIPLLTSSSDALIGKSKFLLGRILYLLNKYLLFLLPFYVELFIWFVKSETPSQVHQT